MNIQATISRYRLLAFVAFAVVGSFLLPIGALSNVSGELITFFGFIMAAVLPAMVLTSTVLRAGNLSYRRLQDYSDALEAQLQVWLGLFVIALAGCVFVIAGKAAAWSIPIQFSLGAKYIAADLAHVLTALTVGCFTLVMLRAYAIGVGIRSLLKLSTEIALSDAQARDKERIAGLKKEMADMGMSRPSETYVDLKH